MQSAQGVWGAQLPIADEVRNARIWGLHRNPAERFLWGKEEQGSVCSFRRKAGTKQSGLCDDARTAPATVYKCALVNKGLMACPRILAGLQSIPQPPEDGTG